VTLFEVDAALAKNGGVAAEVAGEDMGGLGPALRGPVGVRREAVQFFRAVGRAVRVRHLDARGAFENCLAELVFDIYGEEATSEGK
jgi:hypothetical protein